MIVDYCLPSGPNRPDYLRYALRSIEHVQLPIRKIVIAGYLPSYVNPKRVLHIPRTHHPQTRMDMGLAIESIINHKDVAENIIWSDDDVIFMQKPPWPLPVVTRTMSCDEYVSRLTYVDGKTAHNEFVDGCTAQYLMLKSWAVDTATTRWGESHHPLPTTLTEVRGILSRLPKGFPTGSFETLLLSQHQEAKSVKDVKIMRKYSPLHREYLVSVSPKCWKGHVGNLIRSAYTKKSRYEL
jgi:hypothetical protein